MLGAGEPLLQSGSKTVSRRSAPPPLLAPDPIWDASVLGRIALSWQQPELRKKSEWVPWIKRGRRVVLGSPSPEPGLQGVPQSLPLGVTAPSRLCPHAGWANLDKPLEGNSLQQGGGG